MTPEGIALLASISFALFAVYGWLGSRCSTPLTGTIVSLAARTVTLGAAVVFSGGISWKPEAVAPSYRAWHVLYSLSAGFLDGLAFPLRRYGLAITNEPVFFSFVIATVSLFGAVPYIRWTRSGQGLVWNRKGVRYFFSRAFARRWAHCLRSSRSPRPES